jgi:hypothetical protein
MAFLNLSENKIRVTNMRGTDEIVGFMDPKVDMNVYCGEDAFWIVGFVDSSGVIKLGLSSGATDVAFQAYSHECALPYASATGDWGFPSSTGSVGLDQDDPGVSTGLNKFVQNNAGTPQSYTYGS